METSHIFILILSGIGIVNTLYISYHSITKTPVKCLFFPEAWCHKVQFSSWSRTLGIPNSFAGLAFYLSIFGFTVAASQGMGTLIWVKDIVIVGFLFSIYFTFIQAYVLRAFCTWCVVSALDFLLLFLTVMFWI